MGWPVLVLWGLTIVALVTAYRIPDIEESAPFQKHIPPSYVPSFQRYSVEKLPYSQNYQLNQLEFGSQRLPLRSAVEALPDTTGLKSQQLRESVQRIPEYAGKRIPLRDAVEHRNAPFFGGFTHESIWLEQLTTPSVRQTQNSANVVCHFESRGVYRPDPFSLTPESIPVRKCTHLVYNAATLDPNDLTVVSGNPEYDESKGGYKLAVEQKKKNPSLRVLLSIAIPDNRQLFNELTKSWISLKKFSQSILNFVEKNKFDGIAIEWNHKSMDRFKGLTRVIYESLSPKGKLVAMSLGPKVLADPKLAEMSDFLILNSWRASNTRTALHPAPLNFAISATNKWIDAGVSEKKIVLGVPLFGASYTLKFKNSTDLGAPVLGPGIEGEYTKNPGSMAYYEICEKLEDLWTYGRDNEGPYVKRGDQWIGYDDPVSIKLKAAYVKSAELAGISLSSLDLDDFVGVCGEPWPVLTTATVTLGRVDEAIEKCEIPGLYPDPGNCVGYLSCEKGTLYRGLCSDGRFFDKSSKLCVEADPKICIPSLDHSVSQKKQKLKISRYEHDGPRVVCYVTSWSMYRKGDGHFAPEQLNTKMCTDVVYSFAGLNPETLEIQAFDPWADIDNNLFERVTSLNGPRTLLGLGGWTDSSGDKYSRLVNDPSARKQFVASTVNFLQKFGFEGLSFEWLYPKCWQSQCSKGPITDRPNLTKLLQELRREFDTARPKLTLAVAVSGYKEIIDVAYDFPQISNAADFISVMTYDYHGAWEKQVGHLSPLYGTPGERHAFYNTNFTMNYIASLGASKSKLLVGVPFYGQTYRLVRNDFFNLGDPASGAGASGEFTQQPGMLAYYEICDRIKRQNWKVADGPIAHHQEQLVAYEDISSVDRKGRWIVENGFGGATAWTVDLDDFTNRCCSGAFPLLRSLSYALGVQNEAPSTYENCQRPPEPITPPAATLTTPSELALDGANGSYQTTSPMTSPTTTKATTWPTWTEKTTRKPATTSWTWTKPSTTTTRKPTTTTRITTTTTTTTTTTRRTPTGTPCNGVQNVGNPENCGSYFKCDRGVLKLEECPAGLHWDESRGRCNWPALAKCQPGNIVTTPPPTIAAQRPTVTTTSRPFTTTRSPTTTTLVPSKDCEHGQYYAYPNSCTNFLICVNGNLVTQQCGPGLNWDDKKHMCDWAFKNPCQHVPAPNAALVMTEMEEDGKCIPGSFSRVPGDCGSYYTCLWGHEEKFECAPGLHFSEQARICDWPSRAKCPDANQQTVSPPLETESPSTQQPFTSEKPWTAQPTRYTTTHKPWMQNPTTQNHVTTQKPTTHHYVTTQKPTTHNPWIWTEKPKPLPPPLIDPALVSPLSGHFKVVCYFTNWAWYRKGIGRYVPENIDHTLCTHIVYGFAVLDYSNLVIKAHDSWADFDNRFYDRVLQYKKRGLKVSLALGGWNDSAGDKYSRLVSSPEARAKFIEHAIKFLDKYGFDGLDLDWEYPVCWQVDCNKGPKSDKQNFASLLKELSEQLRPRGLLLSSAVSPSKTVVNEGYDVPALAKYLDWIAVMAYDYHGQWDKKTGHVAPLFYHPDDDVYFFNTNYTINYWISKGAPPRSIVLGMPMYGQSFTINDPKSGTGLNSPASAGTAGEFTKAMGFLAYYEICDRIQNHGWTVVQDPEGRIGPYAYKGSQWVSFDDVDMIRKKSQYIRDMGLGGGMIWALDLDDFKNRCKGGAHPLLHAIQQVLADPPNDRDNPIVPPAVGEQLEWKVPSTSTDTSVSEILNQPGVGVTNKNDEYKMVCYFTNWAWYRQNGGRYVPEDIDPDLCTHIVYGFAVLDGSQLTIKTHDSWADIDNKFYERVVAYKAKGIKVLLAIGGWNDSAGDKYSRLVNSASSRARFISHVVQFIEKYGFEGLDLDWEYPVCWQVECSKGPPSDKHSFTLFVKELSETFKPKGLLLSTAVSPSKRVIDAGYEVAELSHYFDWISVMTYDFHGQWDKKTGHVAPLYHHPQDWEPTFNANFSIRYWIEKGASPKKLVMGVPLYGQSFSLAERSQQGLNAPTYGGGEAGEATRARGFLSYYEICERTLMHGWTVVQDAERRMGPYAYKGDQWVSFDDAEQVKLKAEFIKKMGLGGGMVWALDLDDFKNYCGCEPHPLLRTLNRVLRNYPAGPTCRVTEKISGGILPETTTHYPWHETTESVNKITTPGTSYLPPITTTQIIDSIDTIEVTSGGAPPAKPSSGECDGRMFRPHEHDCSKYTICNFGELLVQTCPSGLHWNEDRCDWPENAKCKISTNQIGETNSIPHETQRPEIPVHTELPTVEETTSGHVDHVGLIDSSSRPESTKVVCYFTNWAVYRPGKGKYTPENIDPSLCTHIVYGFAVLDGNDLVMKPHDTGADIDNDFYGKIAAYRAKGIKVLIAIGGWNDSAGDKYSRLVNNQSARKKFIKHALAFIEKYGFDGLDLDWEYPVCWQVECERGPSSDKQAYATFVKELSRELKPRKMLLSAAVSPSKRVIDHGYDVPTLGKYLDWIAVMTYDFHGNWERKTGHVAPLNYYPGDEYDYFNANFSMRYWIQKGAPASRLVMGIPFYGQSFTLSSTWNPGLQSPTSGPGEAGKFTRSAGFLAFYEICDKVKNEGYTVTKDPQRRIGPYAMRDRQWVSYDDVTNVFKKGEFIHELGLAGAMAWALDLDDFNDNCGCGKYPLLKALNHGVRGEQIFSKDCT
ncbi:probable chitinase 10 [Venturia canescens]|uniref:probable chitinase 10 n=1 Tax=Venturia canescens TaxID=32260 RepID=UPI001C9C2543|nr:probable chitinase 10 [Venturia canescens]